MKSSRRAEHVARTGAKGNAYRVLMWIHEGRRPLRRRKRRPGMGGLGVCSSYSGQGGVVGCFEHSNESLVS